MVSKSPSLGVTVAKAAHSSAEAEPICRTKRSFGRVPGITSKSEAFMISSAFHVLIVLLCFKYIPELHWRAVHEIDLLSNLELLWVFEMTEDTISSYPRLRARK